MTRMPSLASPLWGPNLRSSEASPPNTLAAAAYEKLRGDIVAGRLKPGTKLQTEAVKRQYGFGTSPLREALSHLAADGLVRSEGQKGFRVVPVSPGEFADVARLRLMLELQALRDAIARGDMEWEVGLVSAFHRLQHVVDQYSKDPENYAEQWEETHRGFHFALLTGCNSPWLLHFCDRLYDQTERYRRLFTSYDSIPRDLLSEHKAMLDSAIARNADRAAAILGHHIAYAASLTLSDMQKNGVPPDEQAGTVVAKLLKENPEL